MGPCCVKGGGGLVNENRERENTRGFSFSQHQRLVKIIPNTGVCAERRDLLYFTTF
jgi:hypothetical protein